MLIFCMLLFFTETSWADGGAIQFQGDTGQFHITVFTLPPILSAGSIDVTVLVQDRSNLSPLLDATVTLDLIAQDGSDPKREAWSPPCCALNKAAALTDIPAKLDHAENRLLYGALVQIPYSGAWQLNVNIQRNTQRENVRTLLKVNPPAPPPLTYWHLFILPPLGVIGFILNQNARRRKK
ncbi:MAG TPA: hypothetical protein VK673_10100 [Chthoniobacterales bacterium]|nr:hypothetical protein [Chthoniobacterales bacterium]